MKQTVEEAAMNFANYESNNLDKLPFKVKNVVDYDNGLTRGFKAGSDWQSKQSPWISVKERLPEKDGYYFVTDGDIVEKVYFYKIWNKFVSTKEYPHLFFDEGVIKAWLLIPPFDDAHWNGLMRKEIKNE